MLLVGSYSYLADLQTATGRMGKGVRAPSVGGVKGVAAASSLCSPGKYIKSSSFSISSPGSRRAPDLPSSWAGLLCVPHGLTVSSILASGCLDQVHFRHVIQFALRFISSFFSSVSSSVNTEPPGGGSGQ